jgi:peptidoglycan hydrolase-like protein with peptidoglycan-binding domain
LASGFRENIMFSSKALAVATMAAALIAADSHKASADPFVGALLGGFIGSALGSQVGQPRTRARASGAASQGAVNPARETNRQIQTALNFFGFNVGTPDGALGPRSRQGIADYQLYLGFGTTGQLTEFERSVLLSAHQRAQLGGAQVTQVTARHRDGMRGLLEVVRDEMSGAPARRTAGAYGLPPDVASGVDEIAASSDPTAEQLVQRAGFIQLADLNADGRTDYILDTSVTGSAFWCNAQACTVRVYVSTPDGYSRNDFQAFGATPAMFDCLRGTCTLQPGARVVAAASGATDAPAQVAPPVASAQPMVPNPRATAVVVPNFFAGAGAQQVSLASHCNRVGLVTSANGGFTDVGTLSDPIFALNEQFCLARGYAIAEGEGLAAQVPGATSPMIAEQCAGFAPALQPHVAALSLQPRAEVARGVAQFVLASGMAPADLTATARICLSSGYMTENLTVAIGSALLLYALGETGYGELPAHHLMQGIGASQRRELALDWFEASVPQGPMAQAVGFAPGSGNRNALIQAALALIADGVRPAPAPAPTATPTAAPLPLFNLRTGN